MGERTKITPSEVVVGGSLGQGTAVPGKFDIDLVIYTRGEDVSHVTVHISVLNTFIRHAYTGIRKHVHFKSSCGALIVCKKWAPPLNPDGIIFRLLVT